MNIETDISNAVNILRKGGVILYPTDTIWGLGCDATNPDAVERIYQIKKRAENKAMICLVDSEVRAQRYVRNIPDVAWSILEIATEPTTLILPCAVNLAENLIGEDKTVAIRVTRENFSKQLCYKFQKPLVSTSANISGEEAPQNYRDISQTIIDSVDYVCFSRRQEHKPHKPSSIIKVGISGEIEIIRK